MNFSTVPGLGSQLQAVTSAPTPICALPTPAIAACWVPGGLCHLLNCVTASLFSPSLTHAQPWCR